MQRRSSGRVLICESIPRPSHPPLISVRSIGFDVIIDDTYVALRGALGALVVELKVAVYISLTAKLTRIHPSANFTNLECSILPHQQTRMVQFICFKMVSYM